MFGGIRAWTNTWGNSGTPTCFTGATGGVEAVMVAGTDKARPRGATRERMVEAHEGVGDAGAVCQAGGAPKTESTPMGWG